jgi:hypothetical protein
MIELFFSPLVGAIMALGLAIAFELWKGRGRRKLYGEWYVAVQPVFKMEVSSKRRSGTPANTAQLVRGWHIQKVQIKWGPIGLKVETEAAPGKLQWCWYPTLVKDTYLVGRWKSLRPGGFANGYMCVQLAENGTYMCGHDYGAVARHKESNFGILLLARKREDLESARDAMSTGVRPIVPLAETVDFDSSGNPRPAIHVANVI